MEQAEAQITDNSFLRVYQSLLQHHGPQNWWPGETSFEVMVGAILTQNTAWTNVEKAIVRLKQADALAPDRLLSLSETTVADLIRPSGYFNVKTKRLRNYCRWFLKSGGHDALSTWSTSDLREGLLSINGIGPETADDILLYVFERSVFVIDSYTRRLFSRLELINGDLDYEKIRSIFENELEKETPLFNEYHALIDVHAKTVCKTKPDCGSCCLTKYCPYEKKE